MKISNEFKTGLVVLVAVVTGAVFYAKTATVTGGGVYRVKTYFNIAEGVKAESIVKLSGIDVGRVESITFNYAPDTKVELVLVIDRNAKVREDSIAFISQSGLIGDAYVGITAGSPDKQFVKDGAIIASEDPFEMRKFMKKADAIAESIDKTLAEVKVLATNVNGLTTNVNGVVNDNKAKIGTILVNLEDTSANFKDFSEDIKQHPWKLLSKK